MNKDGYVTISDVTTLIDRLLSGDFEETDQFSPVNADVFEDNAVSIADVTTLIDMLLSGGNE